MLNIFKKEVPAMAKGTVQIDQARCKGCQLCIDVCPQGVLYVDHMQLNAKGYHPAALHDPDEICTGCAVCAVMCPDVAITVERAPIARRTRKGTA